MQYAMEIIIWQTGFKITVISCSVTIVKYNNGMANKKNMCVYGHPTHPIFQPPNLTFFIDNFFTEFG